MMMNEVMSCHLWQTIIFDNCVQVFTCLNSWQQKTDTPEGKLTHKAILVLMVIT